MKLIFANKWHEKIKKILLSKIICSILVDSFEVLCCKT